MERAIQLLKQDKEHLEAIIKTYSKTSPYQEKKKMLERDLKGVERAIEILESNNK